MKLFFIKQENFIKIESDDEFRMEIQKLLKQTIIRVRYKTLSIEFESPASFEYIQTRIKSFLELLQEKFENNSIIDLQEFILEILQTCKEGEKMKS